MSTLIFIHIPKCGGVTLSQVIRRQYPEESLYRIDPHRINLTAAEFAALPEEERRKIRILSGHMSYGLHEHLPDEYDYITMLRDPVDRLISHYYFVRKKTSHPLHEELTRSGFSLEEYLSSDKNIELVNGQTRHLSGISDPTVDLVADVGDRALIDAKHNLRNNIAAVGLTERFDESVLLFQHRFGWKVPVYVRRNVNRARPRGRDVSDRAKEIAAERNHLDVELYALARTLFEQHLEEAGIGARELKRFRARNKAYGLRKRIVLAVLGSNRKEPASAKS